MPRITYAAIARRAGLPYLMSWRYLTGGETYPDPEVAAQLVKAHAELVEEATATNAALSRVGALMANHA
ncbi:MAG: hypothetical protein ACYDCQ_03420 [Dehalococcoidia bacterium]